MNEIFPKDILTRIIIKVSLEKYPWKLGLKFTRIAMSIVERVFFSFRFEKPEWKNSLGHIMGVQLRGPH